MAKRGRPPGPCNPRELAQRRGAAWKHGERAATALRRSLHPCRKDLCPVSHPCDLKTAIEGAGGALEACLVELGVSGEDREAYRRAIAEGDLEGLHEIVSASLAANKGLLDRERLAIVLEGGFAIEQPILGKPDDDGHQEIVGHRTQQNPRSIPFLELNKQVGITADQQAATPKARGQTERDISESRHLDWMRDFEPGKTAP